MLAKPFSLLFLSLIFCISCTQKPSNTSSTTKSSDSLKDALIDDFNQRDYQGAIPLSIWTTYNDIGNGGNSSISPRTDLYPNAPDYLDTTGVFNDSTAGSMRFEFKLVKDQFKWDPFVGFSLNLQPNQVQVDMAQVEGIQFWTRGSGFYFVPKLNGVTDYANYQIKIPAHKEWTLVQIPFELLQQPSWGKVVPWDPNTITHLDWMIMGADGTEGVFELDQITWMAQGQYQAPQPETSSNYFDQRWVPAQDTLEYIQDPQYGVKQVLPYYNGHRSAYALTFDDGLASQARELAPILDRHQLKATFFILTEHLGDSLNPPSWRFGTWSQFLELQSQGHELAGHDGDALDKYTSGDFNTPNTLEYQFAISRILLEKANRPKTLVYAYPMGVHDQTIEKTAMQFYQGARTVYPQPMSPQAAEVSWEKIHTHVLTFPVPRTIEGDLAQLEMIKKWIEDNVIQTGKWHTFTAHDIVSMDSLQVQDPGYFSLSKQWMEKFALFLKSKQDAKELWVAPLGHITQYLKQRQALTWGVVSESEDEIVMNFKDTLDDQMFNHELTVDIQVPKQWTQAQVIQGTSRIHPVVDGIIRTNILPDGGVLRIKKQD